MHAADRLAAINSEQLATATDRLLLRGTVARRRPSVRSLVPHSLDRYPRMVSHEPLARGSQPRMTAPRSLPHPAPRSASCPSWMTPPRGEPTLQMRAQVSSARTQVLAVTVVIPTLVGIAVGLAALL
jgi:hypothetical protein